MSFEYTVEELVAELERREKELAGPEATKTNVESATELVAGTPERIGTALGERKQEMVDILGDQEASIPEKTLQMVGKGVAGPIMDVTGEVITTAVGAAADMYDPKIRQGFNDLMNNIMDSEPAKKAIDYYQSLDPRTRRTIESIFNIGNLMSAYKLKPKEGSGLRAQLTEGTTAVNKKQELRRNMLTQLFQSERSKANIEQDLRNGTEKIDSVVNDLMDVKGVSPVYAPERNIKALRDYQSKVEAQIQGQLANFDRKGVWNRDITRSFNDLLNDTLINEPSLRSLGLTAERQANVQASIMRKLNGVVKNMKDDKIKPNSLRGLLEARRRLDKALRDQDFSKMSEGEIGEVALERHVLLQMRGKLNNTISGFVEQMGTGEEKIRDLLKKQSSMYIAEDNYITKTAGKLSDLSERGAITKAIAHHPILVYRALQNAGTSPLLAGVLAVPSGVNIGGNVFGAVRRNLPPSPVTRAGMFYGEEEEQR